MASILRIRDKDGNIIDVPALKGDNGKSAYEVALDNGFEGTEKEWLESLKEERPTETKEFLNDWSESANSDVTGVSSTSNLYLFKSIKDDTFDYANKEIKKIEYSFDGGSSWVDVYDFANPTKPCIIQVGKSIAYNDDTYDTICFGSIYFPTGVGVNQYITDIANQNQYGFRVTYYTD